MSDVGIHLYGLLLDATVALTAILYALIVLVAGTLAVARRDIRYRTWGIANAAALLFLGTCVILILLIHFLDGPEPIWRDWLAIPWLLFFIASLFLIFRKERAKAERTP